ncbi:hypothetical protein U3516DRAFT_650538 [Neocallimastix sp. 'constans']|jgi:hypothetical protein
MEIYKNDIICLQKEVFSYLKNESNLSEQVLLRFSSVLMDEAFIYRFYRKNKFTIPKTKEDIIDHLTWLLDEDVFNNTYDSFELNTNSYDYLLNGLIYFCGRDKLGRPIGIVNLNHYNGNGDIESLKKYMIFILELAQKLIREENKKNSNSIENSVINNKKNTKQRDIQTQISIILDLDNLKMSSLNYEIFPSLIKIFINHYPYITETLYILNYRWIHAGLWGMVKQMLSESITKNMLFLKKNEIFDYIDPDELLVEFGGNNHYKYNFHTCSLYEKFCKKQNLTSIPLHLLDPEELNVESKSHEINIDNEDKWFDACSDDNEIKEITEEIIQKPEYIIEQRPSVPPLTFNNASSIKNNSIYPIKKDNCLYEDESVLNISYHPINLSIKESNMKNSKMVKTPSFSAKLLIYSIIRYIIMPFYIYIRRVRCTSIYFELILSRWIKKFSDESSIPPSFNYLSFFITSSKNMSGTDNNNPIDNIPNDMIQATDSTSSSSSSVTSATLVSPSTINYISDSPSNYHNTYSAYPTSPSTTSSCHQRQSSIFDRSNNNGSISLEDINSLVQHTLKSCIPKYYNPFKDSITLLILFASYTLLTHLIYPRNRYRVYSSFWKYLYKFRREIYIFLGLRPNSSKSIIQVI